ncbi:DUF4215 domain-containing protein [Sandaracinus amylolyticus]|uniref:Multiple EGF-like-domain protein 3 n=1 Tax=Sandaracinus amylolyticus TaxID=927083 RepID=A0A0F6W280_9BACT|nr:DUF4215 domain-containing protein [Sandaracinus amylolyticus]AKF05542.1 Multiple EGF-like-domain protein 3 precursor [Sandaracinus amylolyticus]
MLALALGTAACGDDDGDPGDASTGVDAQVGTDAGPSETRCGDGTVQMGDGEICDDGNTTDGDGCSADCRSDETCGNGVLDEAADEVCDDGNTADGDTCRGDCASDYRCGNGVVDTTADGASSDEVCDDGNTANGDGCSASCSSDESCGNAIVDLGAGEICDDGNTEDGDECSADCLTSFLCGNGDLDGAEECDDGNDADGDGCNASCQQERCGNGRVDAGEACDDGNDVETDGCQLDCTFTCSSDADCDDGAVCNGAEVCSAPGTTTSACAPAASPAPDGAACGTGQICLTGGCVASACGDGFTDASRGEQCDDVNTVSGDGCENDCTFTCSSAADCSDGAVCNGPEVCMNAGSVASRCAAGSPASNGTSCGGGQICIGGACTTAGCGDGVVSGAEQCDDGNTSNGDGCDADCRWTCTAATAVADCGDGNACNGVEVCTAGGSLASRCGPGTAPANGASCGGTNICVGGACVARRCGDMIVSTGEQCDDGNTANADGCDNDCTWTCAGAADCSDGNVCNGAEVCTSPSTLGSRCGAGTPAATGTTCDRDANASTRDICRSSVCVASACGDGYVDAMSSPVEQCDDGNTAGGDGCSATCTIEMSMPPTGFRITSLTLISPRVIVDVPLGGCQDITVNCASVFGGCAADGVNTMLAQALNPTTTTGGEYSLHLVPIFRPYAPGTATTPADFHLNAECNQSPTPDSCGPAATAPSVAMSSVTNRSTGTCFTPIASEVNTRAGTPAAYPTVNTVSGPCFISDAETLTIDIGGILVPLRDATLSAAYDGTAVGSRRLVNGVVRGFLTEADALTAALPADLPLVGGDPLYEHLQAGNRTVSGVADACNVGGGTNEDDADMNGTTRGFWFFLNFTAEEITWTGT